MAPFALVHQRRELLVFALTIEKLADCSATACVGQIGQFTDSLVKISVRTNDKGVLIHC